MRLCTIAVLSTSASLAVVSACHATEPEAEVQARRPSRTEVERDAASTSNERDASNSASDGSADDDSADDAPAVPDDGPGDDSAADDDTGIDDDADDAPEGTDSGTVANVRLFGAPLIFAPTATGFGVNAVLYEGDPSQLKAYVHEVGEAAWASAEALFPAEDVAEWYFEELTPGTQYEYLVVSEQNDAQTALFLGTATTQRPPGEEFTFALLTDTHVPPREGITPGSVDVQVPQEETLVAVTADVRRDTPDFLVNLGDMLDFHLFGFNNPPPDGSWTRLAYLNYRQLLLDTLGNAAHFGVIGNWDGENGDYTDEQIAYSRQQRLSYVPGPSPNTYEEGGNVDEDYYAFTWGDALFVVLNVMTYTPTPHLLSFNPGVADDWTLGEEQLAWLEETLENATSKWRFLLIHHAVGGAAGDEINAAYGRGGGQAAYVGEQAIVHDLMLEHGVQIFFYGHDHVFTDMVVDGIHYTLPGSAGAPWKFTTVETGYEEYWPDSGYGRVHVSPQTVRVEFVARGGEVLHQYTLE